MALSKGLLVAFVSGASAGQLRSSLPGVPEWISSCPGGDGECQSFVWPPATQLSLLGNASAVTGQNATVALGDFAAHRSQLLEGCGEICDTGKKGSKKVNCPALYTNRYADSPAIAWPPPRFPPEAFKQDYLMGGEVALRSQYFAQRTSGTTGSFGTPQQAGWTVAGINQMIKEVGWGTLAGGYGNADTMAIKKFVMKNQARFKGKRLLVVGSLKPWLEAILLFAGAKHVTTVEYGSLPREPHPKVSTMTPAELAEAFNAGKAPTFEGGASYSSIEHSGLGRYGDTLNPWGDLQAVAKVWCVMEPGASFMIGVPSGEDTLVWNAHRFYGPKRWPQLMANWKHLESTPLLGTWRQQAALYEKLEV